MKEELQVILTKVLALFLRYGIKSLTMDDIARELKISKKTLYEYVEDKKDLVHRVVQYQMDQERCSTCQILESYQNAIDELLAISDHVRENIKQIHPSVFYDLEKYYPESWDVFKKFKSEFIYQCMAENLKKGIKQGIYRKDINTMVVPRFYIHMIDLLFNPEVFPTGDFTKESLYREMIQYHIHGISNQKGIEYLSKLSKDL